MAPPAIQRRRDNNPLRGTFNSKSSKRHTCRHGVQAVAVSASNSQLTNLQPLSASISAAAPAALAHPPFNTLQIPDTAADDWAAARKSVEQAGGVRIQITRDEANQILREEFRRKTGYIAENTRQAQDFRKRRREIISTASEVDFDDKSVDEERLQELDRNYDPTMSGNSSGFSFGTQNTTPQGNRTQPSTTQSTTPFGQPPTTTTSTTPFGQPPTTSIFGSTTNQGSSVFGGGSKQSSSTTSNLFGTQNNQSSISSANIFGNTGNQNSNPSSSVFGAQNSSSNQPASTRGPLFNFAPSSTPTASSGSGNASGNDSAGSNLFGNLNSTSAGAPASSTPAQSSNPTPTISLFGATNTATPAASSTTGNLFGGGSQASSTTPSSIFGSSNTPAASKPPTSGLFASTTPNAATSSAPTSNIFSNLGGGTTTTTSASTPTLFGGTAPAFSAPTGGLFGSASNAPATTTSGPSLFGAQSATASPALTSTSQGGGLFGAKPATTTSNTPSTGLFGGAASTQAISSSSAPASGGLFGGRPNSTTTSGTTPSLFAPPASNASSSTTPAPTGSTLFSSNAAQTPAGAPPPPNFSGLLSGNTNSNPATQPKPLFGATNTTTAPASTSGTPTTGSTAPSAANLFGAPRGANTAPPASTTAGGLFGATTTTGAPSTASSAAPGSSTTTATTTSAASAAPTAAAPGGLFGASSNAATGTAPAASTSGPAAPQHSRLANKSMDDILTMWSTSLASHQKTFQQLAQRVAAWDRVLVENSSKISTLYGRCFQAERDCSEVERQLTNVEYGQKELEALLDRYESEVDRALENAGLGENGTGASGVDAERERTYKAAEACTARLTDMHHSLTDMIEEINSSSSHLSTSVTGKKSSGAGDDPLADIVRVLNSHLSQLQAIDAGATALQSKVAAAQQEARSLGERTGSLGQMRREEGLEAFGRSYLGRR